MNEKERMDRHNVRVGRWNALCGEMATEGAAMRERLEKTFRALQGELEDVEDEVIRLDARCDELRSEVEASSSHHQELRVLAGCTTGQTLYGRLKELVPAKGAAGPGEKLNFVSGETVPPGASIEEAREIAERWREGHAVLFRENTQLKKQLGDPRVSGLVPAQDKEDVR